jgi:hypothetical protein
VLAQVMTCQHDLPAASITCLIMPPLPRLTCLTAVSRLYLVSGGTAGTMTLQLPSLFRMNFQYLRGPAACSAQTLKQQL